MTGLFKSLVLLALFAACAWSYQLQLAYAKVHEAITERAAHNAGLRYTSDLKKGIRWNDMPCSGNVYTTKVELCSWRVITDIDKPGTITYESHNGKYSFWHSMAPPGQFTNQQLVNMAIEQFRKWYLIAVQHNSLFGIGKCLHMVQDSYSRAHMARDSSYRIQFFQSYPLQDADKHANLEGGAICKRQHWSQLYGANHAVAASTKILVFFKNRAPWHQVEHYLRSVVYAIAPGAANKISGGTIAEAAKSGVKARSFHDIIAHTPMVKNLKKIVQWKHKLKTELKVIKKFSNQVKHTHSKPQPRRPFRPRPFFFRPVIRHFHRPRFFRPRVYHPPRFHRPRFFFRPRVYHPPRFHRPRFFFHRPRHIRRWRWDHRRRRMVFSASSAASVLFISRIRRAFRKARSKVVKTFKKAAAKIKRAIKIASNLVKETFKKIGKMACRFLKDAGYSIKNAASKINRKLKSAGRSLKSKAKSVTRKVNAASKKFVQKFRRVLPRNVRSKARRFFRKLRRF